MHVIGLCRFSYLAVGGFQVEFDTDEALMAHLYDPARMADRFRTFETITLPSIRAQTDPDFTFLVVTGETLPEPHLERLYALLEDIPQAVLQVYPPIRHRQIMKDAINSVRPRDGAPCLQFRLDDDDAVAVDFVERLRADAVRCAGVCQNERFVGIDYTHGFLLRPAPAGLLVRETVAPLLTAALAVWAAPDTDLTVMNFGHHRLCEFMPVVSLPTPGMYVRTLTDFNDSHMNRPRRGPELLPLTPEQRAALRDRFAIDADRVRIAWADQDINTG